jgi:hypothetical protein
MVDAAGQLAREEPARPARSGWLPRMRRAVQFGLRDTDTGVVALAGFLLRGGFFVVLLPIVVLPSVIGLAGATGVEAFGIDGHPTAWLFEIAAVVAAIAAAYLILAFVVGSLVDVLVIGATLDPDAGAAPRTRSLPGMGLVIDLAIIRAICAAPLGPTIYWAGAQIYSSAYDELTTPTNLATPLALRVVQAAAPAVLVLVLAWLVSEVFGAMVIRRMVLLDTGIVRSFAGALLQLVSRPISTIATSIVSYGVSAAAIGLALVASATTFDWCRVVARISQPITITIGAAPFSTTRDFRPVVFMLSAAALCVTWIVALAISGVASAWRSAALTGETLAAEPAVDIEAAALRCGLSGLEPGRSWD